MRQVLLAALVLAGSSVGAQALPSYDQKYTANNYDYLIGMEGFTAGALKKHFTLYEECVGATNLFLSILSDLAKADKENTPCWMAMKRRVSWYWDCMRLHEYYFDNMGGNGQPNLESPLYKIIVDQYGSFDSWAADYKATGILDGIGWVILYQDPYTGRLVNDWVNEHPDGHLAGSTPILVMDVWEHAYILDFGLDRKAYIDAFFKNIDWDVVDKRYAIANDPKRPKLESLEQASSKSTKAGGSDAQPTNH